MSADRVTVTAVEGLPEVAEGMKVGELIAAEAALEPGDVVVVSQKIVSKAEGRVVPLDGVKPGAEARRLAAKLDKDPAMVELILSESREVLRAEHGVLIVETKHGLVCANAGIDASNLPADGTVCLLPEDPDTSARHLRAELTTAMEGRVESRLAGHSPSAEATLDPPPTRIAVVISDSFGRAWRLGQAEVAIGCAGLAPLDDWRGRRDTAGRELAATVIAIADQVAAAADLIRDKTSRTPAAIVRGLSHHVTADDGLGAAALRRPPTEDLFR